LLKFENDTLYFLPLGGSSEIGMNLNLYYYQGTWIMLDCGMMIHDRDDGDDEILFPDIQFLEDKTVSALVVTHAHEDHIGAITDLWSRLRCPIYATPFAAAILRRKFKENKMPVNIPIQVQDGKTRFEIGPFELDYIPMTHSTVESQAVAIRTDAGNVLHTGDWKLDPQPLIGSVTAEDRLKQFGDEGVLAVVGDSTNATIEGWSGSESTVRQTLTKLIAKEKNRVVCACFSSNIARIATFLFIAEKTGRHPVLVGRSLKRMVSAAQEVGYLPRGIQFIPPHEAMYLPPSRIMLICTGSQAESRAALNRIAMHTHPHIVLDRDDVAYFSSKVIPGNEQEIENLQIKLKRQGVRVISEDMEEIHVSGHPCVDELKVMYEWIRPHILIPVHGYPKHLTAHAEVGRACNIPHVIEVRNGHCIKLDEHDPCKIGEVPVGIHVRPPDDFNRRKSRGRGRGRGKGRSNDAQSRNRHTDDSSHGPTDRQNQSKNAKSSHGRSNTSSTRSSQMRRRDEDVVMRRKRFITEQSNRLSLHDEVEVETDTANHKPKRRRKRSQSSSK
jgi:ribonuclease J